jgi:putative acetyltransferase
MRCRPASEADIDWLAGLSVAAYQQSFVPLMPALDWHLRDAASFRARFAREWPKARIGEWNGLRLGFHLMSGAHIDMFFVDPQQTRRGIGAALLADAVAHGALTLECFAVNAAARRFYERHGWRLESAHVREFLGSDCEFVRYRRSDLTA